MDMPPLGVGLRSLCAACPSIPAALLLASEGLAGQWPPAVVFASPPPGVGPLMAMYGLLFLTSLMACAICLYLGNPRRLWLSTTLLLLGGLSLALDLFFRPLPGPFMAPGIPGPPGRIPVPGPGFPIVLACGYIVATAVLVRSHQSTSVTAPSIHRWLGVVMAAGGLVALAASLLPSAILEWRGHWMTGLHLALGLTCLALPVLSRRSLPDSIFCLGLGLFLLLQGVPAMMLAREISPPPWLPGLLRAQTVIQASFLGLAMLHRVRGLRQEGVRIREARRDTEVRLASQRKLFREISHELGSPLTRLSLAVDLAARDRNDVSFDRIRREVELLSALKDEMLILSRLQARYEAAGREPVDMSILVREVAADAEFEADGAVQVLVQGERGAVVLANRGQLRRALDNVVRNGLKYAAEGGRIVVRVETVSRSGRPGLLLSVRDYGLGVPENVLPRLTEPFFRLQGIEGDREGAWPPGAGLGLSIAEQIVRLHDGELSVANAEGGGLHVSLRLPLHVSQGDSCPCQDAEYRLLPVAKAGT